MNYVMELYQQKNSIKNALMVRLVSEEPFPFYPKGTSFELHERDFIVLDTVVCYHVNNDGDKKVKELVHRVLLEQA